MAFNPEVARLLSTQFAESKTQKTYHCLVRGFCDEAGVIDYPLAKLNEQKGRSRFKLEGTERACRNSIYQIGAIPIFPCLLVDMTACG